MKYWVAFLLTFAAATPASADWHEASSDHFVIYYDTRADDLERFAVMLERHHQAMELSTGRQLDIPSPSNRVTVYAVGSDRNLRELYGDKNSSVAGFYIPRAAGSRAFVPNIRIGSGEPDFSLTVLLHEYAHHFLISSSVHAMPRWLSEGSAEFFGSTRFPSNGTLEIGRPAYHRQGELAFAEGVPVQELFDHELFQKNHGNKFDAFYGRSWGLFHYLTYSKEREGQLVKYRQAVAGGVPSTEAAKLSFGDLNQLEKELKSYLRTRRFPGKIWNPEAAPVGHVSVRKLSQGMGEMMPVIIRSQRGVDDQEAAALVPQARAIAAKYAGDAGVLTALAEAEYDAGNDAEAIAAANQALAINPSAKSAYVQKGNALFRIAKTADDQDKAYEAAMKPFAALNQLEQDHTQPLIRYYRSFAERGKFPPEGARHALERASQLAMFDKSLLMEVALMQAREGKTTIAAYTLAPLAADPHGGRRAELASALISALKQAKDGEPFDASTVMRAIPDDESDGDDASED